MISDVDAQKQGSTQFISVLLLYTRERIKQKNIYQEPDEENVGEGGGEEDDLPGGLDRLPDAKVNDDPSQKEKAKKLPTDSTKVVDVERHLKHTVTEKIKTKN